MLFPQRQHAITLVRELTPGTAAEVTRELRDINHLVWQGSPGYAAGNIETLHHLACFVLEMHGRHYAALEANVDGPVDVFLQRLCRSCPDLVERAFSRCIHAPDGPARTWGGFLAGGLRPYGIFHIGNTGRLARHIKSEGALLDELATRRNAIMASAHSRSDAWARLSASLSGAEAQTVKDMDPRPLLVRINPLNRRTRARNLLGLSLLQRAVTTLLAFAAFLALGTEVKWSVGAVGACWGLIGLIFMTASAPRLLAWRPRLRVFAGHAVEAAVSGAGLTVLLGAIAFIWIEYELIAGWLVWITGWVSALYAIVLLVLLAWVTLRPIAAALALVAGFATAFTMMASASSAWYGLAYGLLFFAGAVTLTLLLLVAIATKLRSAEATDYTDDSDTREKQLPATIGPDEDRFAQNHLASLTVMKPGLMRAWVLGIVMRTINLLARVSENLGDLGVIASIHFGRFVVLNEAPQGKDDNGYLLFLGNYDGDWSSYLGDFKGAKGLSAIWSHTRGFPRTLLLAWNGGQNERQFKRYARNSQVESLVWYCAYPDRIVPRVDDATFTCEDLARPGPRAYPPGFRGDLARWRENAMTEAELDAALRRLQ